LKTNVRINFWHKITILSKNGKFLIYSLGKLFKKNYNIDPMSCTHVVIRQPLEMFQSGFQEQSGRTAKNSGFVCTDLYDAGASDASDVRHQGDQIGRFFSYWVKNYFR
jgi:hypothetical protein